MENGTLRDRGLRQSSLWDLSAWCASARLQPGQLPGRFVGLRWRGLLCALGLNLALLGGVAPAQAFTGTDTGTTPNFCLPNEDSFDWGDCYRHNFTVMGSSWAALTSLSSTLGVSTAAIQADLDAEEAARIAADYSVGAATKTFSTYQGTASVVTDSLQVWKGTASLVIDSLQVWKGTVSPHIATYDVWKGTISPAIAGKADKGNTAHIDLSTVTTALAGKAPLTGAGTSGTWGISVTGNAATVTTNANLTGPVTSAGNATTIVGPMPPTAVDLSTVTTALALKADKGNTAHIDLSTVTTALSGKAGTGSCVANAFINNAAQGGPTCAQPGDTSGAAALNVLKAGDTMTGRLTAPDATLTYGLNATTGSFSGSVGIGTTSPGNPFHVSGDTSGNVAWFESKLANSATVYIQAASGAGYIGTNGQATFALRTNTVDRVIVPNAAITTGGALCLNASKVLSKCTNAPDASGNCTCP